LNQAPQDYAILERDEFTGVDAEACRSGQDFVQKPIIRDRKAQVPKT